MFARVLTAVSLIIPSAAAAVDTAVGVTRNGTPIAAILGEEDLDDKNTKTRILLVGGLDTSPASVHAVRAAYEWFGSAWSYRRRYTLSAIPDADPDRTGALRFPPKGEAYGGAESPEAMYLWRWIGVHAPDLVVVLRDGGVWAGVPGTVPAMVKLHKRLKITRAPSSDSLAAQLPVEKPAGVGEIPAIEVPARRESLELVLDAVNASGYRGPSPARAEIRQRLARSPRQVAQQLSAVYGHQLPEAVYIPAMAVLGRLRLGQLDDVQRIVEPYFTGKQASLAKPSGSHLSGHLLFGELFRLTRVPRYLELSRSAADLAFDERGQMREAMPMHSEMSDSVFMGCPILAQTGTLTGEDRYFEMALRHFRFMRALDLRSDGIWRHSPLDEAAWGRGNGFPALGLALTLSDFPENHPGRPELLAAFRAHMEALVKHQGESGAWRQVIDRPESYREMTATCMIAFSMLRGLRSGWLDHPAFRQSVDRAWAAVKKRTAADGSLIDVCASTGKQPSLRHYFDRPALLGVDPRGGAMALMLATEMLAATPPPAR